MMLILLNDHNHNHNHNHNRLNDHNHNNDYNNENHSYHQHRCQRYHHHHRPPNHHSCLTQIDNVVANQLLQRKIWNGTFFRNVPKGISSYLILMEGIIFWDVDSAFANSKIIPGWNPQLLPVTKNLHGDNIRKILVKKMRMFFSTRCHVRPCFIFHLSQTVVITLCNNFCFAFYFQNPTCSHGRIV